MIKCPYVFLEDQLAGRRRLYQNPCEIISAHTAEEVVSALARMETCKAQGKYLAGYFAYEMGYMFEDKLRPLLNQRSRTPLLQFGVFDNYSGADLPALGWGELGGFKPAWSQTIYKKHFAKVMALIEAGDVYQVNLSFPMHGTYSGQASGVYAMLKSAQPVSYGGVVSLGGADIVTLSPELFYERNGENISMRPMKGTVRRGKTKTEDTTLAKTLQLDTKNRAENLMIVDLLRNDLSKIANAGSVKVTDLYTLETYPSLHTMTSGIEAEVKDISLTQILQALFPCGSVTGAPKIRAQEIIHGLETAPRGAYCGAIGLIDPPRENNDGYSRFNVGIRTLELHRDGRCHYAVGSGIVADSDGREEYAECLLKAALLRTEFGLIETFGWHEQTGFMWLDLHLARLKKSAAALGFKYCEEDILQALTSAVKSLSGPQKVRLEISKYCAVKVETAALRVANSSEAISITLSKNPLSSNDILCAHKTTKRGFIEAELRRLNAETGCAEVLFFNQRGELCEGSYTNVFISKDGQMLTPPLSCGLLPGVLRQALIESGTVHQQVLTLDDVHNADAIYIGNSVRGLMQAHLTSNVRQ